MILGVIQQLSTWTEFCHFLTPPLPLRGQFLYPMRGQKQNFLTPSPPHPVHVVIECTLRNMLKAITNFKIHQKILKYWFTL